MIRNTQLINRFLRYAAIDTQSDENAEEQPSTAKQRVLAEILAGELRELGADVYYDEEHCYVYASLPGEEPALGFIAHMDTSPDASGENVTPRIIESYDGKAVVLGKAAGNAEPSDDTAENLTILDPAYFPELKRHVGEDIITAGGTTLLGADDKAGVAEIMEMITFYAQHPDVPHRRICVAFTPDEEVGRGTENFDIGRFGAKEAYTADGGKLGEIEYECFNAASASIEVFGKSVHPGDAKGKMINAAALAVEFHGMLPPAEVPAHTEGYEGFYHLCSIDGGCEYASLKYIIRDHDRSRFEARKETVRRIAGYLNEKYGAGTFVLKIEDQYYNMADLMQEHMHLIENAKAALQELGVTASVVPIRGGTDGAKLTYMGVPCPNLCTGGYNFHGRYEYASVQEMEICAEMLKLLARI